MLRTPDEAWMDVAAALCSAAQRGEICTPRAKTRSLDDNPAAAEQAATCNMMIQLECARRPRGCGATRNGG
jgi:hypothetical protein